MVFKPTSKSLKPLLLIAYFAVVAFSTNVSAAPVVIDFGTGSFGSVGTIVDGGATLTGTGITIGVLDVFGTAADGQYTTDAVLNFSATGGVVNGVTTTGTAGTIEIVGRVPGLLSRKDPITLLSGTFDSWSFQNNGFASVFQGSGLDVKHIDLLTRLNVDINTQFEFFGFSMGFDFSQDGTATAISTDVINTSVVPVPAAVWLFGSGLIGLVGVARRRA